MTELIGSLYSPRVLVALQNKFFNAREILNELNEAWGEKHLTICHAMFPP